MLVFLVCGKCCGQWQPPQGQLVCQDPRGSTANAGIVVIAQEHTFQRELGILSLLIILIHQINDLCRVRLGGSRVREGAYMRISASTLDQLQATIYTAPDRGMLQLLGAAAISRSGKGDLLYLRLSRCYGWRCLGSGQQGDGWVCRTGNRGC